MQTEFFIGRYDLDFLDDFYPDDLPQEWRFDFYSNQFNALLLPVDTKEDIEGIFEELDDKFQLVFEVSAGDIKSKKLTHILELAKGKDNIMFWMSTDTKPNIEAIKLFKNYQLTIQSNKVLKIAKFQEYYIHNVYLYSKHCPVVVSSLSLSDSDIKNFLTSIANTKQKTIIICRSAEGGNLERARLISEMMGY